MADITYKGATVSELLIPGSLGTPDDDEPTRITLAAGSGSLPVGGTTGEVLTKASDADGDVEWAAGGGSQPINSPLAIDGCQLWLDASTLALADDAPVTTWPDGSGNGYDATGSGVARPVCKTGVQNGKRVVRFDTETNAEQEIIAVNQGAKTFTISGSHSSDYGAGRTLSVAGSTGNDGLYTVASVSEGGGNTVVVVVEAIPNATGDGFMHTLPVPKFLTLATAGAILRDCPGMTIAIVSSATVAGALFWASINGDPTTARANLYSNSFNVQPDDEGSSEPIGPNQAIDTLGATKTFWLTRVDWSVVKSGGAMALSELSGVLDAWDPGITYFEGVGSSSDTDSDLVQVGTDGTNPYDGDVGEIIIYNRALSAAERAQLFAYVLAKWDLPYMAMLG